MNRTRIRSFVMRGAAAVAMALSAQVTWPASADDKPAAAFLTIAAFHAHQEVCKGVTKLFSSADHDVLVDMLGRLGLDPAEPGHASVIAGYVARVKDGIPANGSDSWCKTIRREVADLISWVSGQ